MAQRVINPGGYVRWYADKKGWSLASTNVMVEGVHDQNYFQLASNLYREEHGLTLLGKNLSVFPSGQGNDGGTDGIENYFPRLREYIALDTNEDKQLFKVITLMDDDSAGKATLRLLTLAAHEN